MNILEKYEEAHTAFRTGSVLTDSNDKLLMYLSGLSNQNNINEGTQHRDIIRGLTINNILLQRHIEKLQAHITELDKKNSLTTLAVVALTVASLIGTGFQTWYGYKADNRVEAESTAIAAKQPAQPLSMPTPHPAEFRSSAPANLDSVPAKK